MALARHSEGPPFRRVRGRHSEKPPFSAISSSDNLRLGIRLGLGLGLGSVVLLWQYRELFPATTRNDGFQNDGPFRNGSHSEWRTGTGENTCIREPIFATIAIHHQTVDTS